MSQTQMNMICHGVTFYQLNLSLATQLPKDSADLAAQRAVNRSATIFRNEHDVIFTVTTVRESYQIDSVG